MNEPSLLSESHLSHSPLVHAELLRATTNFSSSAQPADSVHQCSLLLQVQLFCAQSQMPNVATLNLSTTAHSYWALSQVPQSVVVLLQFRCELRSSSMQLHCRYRARSHLSSSQANIYKHQRRVRVRKLRCHSKMLSHLRDIAMHSLLPL